MYNMLIILENYLLRKPMICTFQERKFLQKQLIDEIATFDYSFTRYKVNYSIAIAYTENKIDMEAMNAFLRKTDHLVVLNEYTCAVVFDHANDEDGIKAANHLLTYFQAFHFGETLYACVVTASNYSDQSKMVHDIFQLLDYAISENMNNLILDISQVISN